MGPDGRRYSGRDHIGLYGLFHLGQEDRPLGTQGRFHHSAVAEAPVIWLLAFATLFTPMRDRMEPNVLLVGMYSSCPDNDDGSFGERIFPYIVKGKTLFALHLGPNTELALFAGPELEPHESHDSPANLLYPAYRIGDLNTLRGDRNWSIGSLHVWLSAVKAGGSDPACESFFVKLTQTPVRFASTIRGGIQANAQDR